MPKFANDVDLMHNALENARLESVTNPAEIRPGRVWFDPVAGRLMFGNAAGDAAIDPTARANHTGTQLAATISDLETSVKSYPINTFAVPTAALDLNGKKIVDIADATNPQDAVSYGQFLSMVEAIEDAVDDAVNDSESAAWLKFPVVAVADANIALHSGLPTIDGVAVTALKPVLLAGQTTATERGIWFVVPADYDWATEHAGNATLAAVPTGNWIRYVPGEGSQTTLAGSIVQVLSGGTTYGGTIWTLEGTDPTDDRLGDAQSWVISNYEYTLARVLAQPLNTFAAPTGAVSLNTQKITGLADGTNPQDAVAFHQLTDALGDSDSSLQEIAERTLDEIPVAAATVNLNTQRITNLAAPTADSDAVNRGYVTTVRGEIEARTLDVIPAPVAPVSMNTQRLTALAPALAGTDAVNRDQLFDVRDDLLAVTLDAVPAPVADVDFNNQKIVGLAAGTNPGDGVNVGQLAAVIAGVDYKDGVRVTNSAADGNVTLTGLQTIDGIALADGDRVLLTDQDDPAENLIWIAHTGAWTVADDSDNGSLKAGAQVLVEESGSTYKGSRWRLNTTGAITVGTTDLAWVQTGAGEMYTASGDGIELDGLMFKLTPDTGRVKATALGDGTSTLLTWTHGLGTRDIVFSVFYDDDGQDVECDIRRTTVNTATFEFAVAPPANSLRAVAAAVRLA